MRARHAWMLGVGLVAGSLALWQCSGVSPTLNLSGASDASASSSGPGVGSSSSSGSGGDNSSSSGGIDTADAGDSMDATLSDGRASDAAIDSAPACIGPEGGVPCTPGVVACGGPGPCTTNTNACCQPNPPDGGAQGTCQPNSASCSNGVKVQCEEAADCPSGYVCCEEFPAFATLGPTSCMATCPSTSSQICRTHAECANDAGSPARCVLQTCGSMFGGGRSVTLEACSVGSTNGGALPYCMAN